MTTISDLGLSLIDFHSKVLNNGFLLLDIFAIVSKKLSKFSSVSLFNIYFGTVSFYLALGLVSICSKFRNIEDKRALRYIQYLRKNVIKFFIIFCKTPYFFIYGQLKIIKC